MMLAVIAACLIPLAAGWLALPYRGRAAPAERWSHTWLMGAALVTTGLVLAGRLGAPMTRFTALAVGAAAVLAAAGLALTRRSRAESKPDTVPIGEGGWLWALLCIPIALRVFWVVAEAVVSPVHLYDAFDNWLLRARNIVLLGHVPLDPASPQYLGGGKTDYPLGTSMLAAWPALLLGRWDEWIIHVAWPAYYLALLGLCYGFVRDRAGRPAAYIVAYALSSLPLVGVHAARPGYADLPLAVHLLAAALSAWNAIERRRPGAIGVAGVHALFCVLLKREGLIFLLLLLAVTVLAHRGWQRGAALRRFVPAAVGLALGGFALAALADVGFIRRELAALRWHGEVLLPIRHRLFNWDNWNLSWWLLTPLLPVACWRLWRGGSRLPVLAVVALTGFLAFVFLFTTNAVHAVNGYTFDRSVLQVFPLLAVVTVVGLCGTRLNCTVAANIPEG